MNAQFVLTLDCTTPAFSETLTDDPARNRAIEVSRILREVVGTYRLTGERAS